MNNRVSLVKGVFQYSISTWVNFVLGCLFVIIGTRLLKPDVYGTVSLFYSITSVFLYVLTLGLDGAYIRFYNEVPGEDTKSQLLYKNLVISILVCVIAGCISSFCFGVSLSHKIFGIDSRIIIGLLFLYVLCQIILRFLNISYRMSFRVNKYNFQNILINSLSKFLIIIAAIFTDGFVNIISVLTVGMAIIVVSYSFSQRCEYIPYDKTGNLNLSLSLIGYKEYIKFALFSAPTYIIVYLSTYVNQQIISSNISTFALGIFASAGMFSAILGAIKGGFATFWSAYVYQNYSEDQQRIGAMHDFVVAISLVAIICLTSCRDIIYLFIGRDYHESKLFFSLLLAMPILSFISETTEKGISLAKKNHVTLINHSVSIIVNIALSLILIPYYSLIGAAWANAISALLLFILNTLYGQKYYKSILAPRKSIIGISLALVLLIIPTLVHNIIYILLFNLTIGLVSLWVYKNEFLKIKNMVIAKIKR